MNCPVCRNPYLRKVVIRGYAYFYHDSNQYANYCMKDVQR